MNIVFEGEKRFKKVMRCEKDTLKYLELREESIEIETEKRN